MRGAADSPSTALLAAWLRLALDVPVDWALPRPETSGRTASSRCASIRESGEVAARAPELRRSRSSPSPASPMHDLAFPRRTLRECLAEELRRLDPDVLYGRVITEGWELLGPRRIGDASRTHERDGRMSETHG